MEEVSPQPPPTSARGLVPQGRARDFFQDLPSFRDGPKDQTSDAQLRIGESRDSVRVSDAPRNDGEQRVHRTKILMPRIAPLLLAVAGLILFGQGAYIHAKAMLAQVLLQRAFTETVTTGHEVKPWSWADTWPIARI